ncbi:MAG: hypothetical protein WBV93_10265 [Anaerobacillus sp.]
MFENLSEVYLKQDNVFKSQSKMFHVASQDKIIGTVEEDLSTSKNFVNQLLKVISLYGSTSLHLKLLDNQTGLMGDLTRDRGFNQDYTYYSKKEGLSYIIETKISIKNPSLTIYNEEKEKIISVNGGFGANSFDVKSETEGEAIMTVKKSMVPSSLKQLVKSTDVYSLKFTDNAKKYAEDLLLVIGIVLDLSFHER